VAYFNNLIFDTVSPGKGGKSMREDMKFMIETRNLGPEQIFTASLIAGMSSFGILNQAVVSWAAYRIGEDLAEYYGICKPSNTDEMAHPIEAGTIDIFTKSVNILQSMLRISDEIATMEDGSIITIKIRNSKCRYCPKGVGRAELSGTLCPFPSLIEKFVNVLSGRTVVTIYKEKSAPLLKKEDDWCIIRYIFPR
jgi:hypothetical protein